MKPVRLPSLLVWVLVWTLVGAPRGASAGPPDAKATAAADASGRAHFQRGQRLSASGDYEAAYREFEAGYAVTHRPLFLFNMAEAARASGNASRARENYLEFLRVDPTSALAATAQARIDELDRAAGLPPRPDPARPVTPPPVITTPGGTPSEPPPPPPSVTTIQPPGMSPVERLPAEPLATAHGDPRAPIWKKWPFWAAVGGVLAGGAIVFAVSRGGGSICGAGCTPINFR